MSVPIYIITLSTASHRRAFQEAQASRLGFSPIWHPAMGIHDFSDEVFLQHAFSWQRALKKTEVGCFLSHLQIWQLIAESSSPAVVLEDDAILADEWLCTIETLTEFQEADVINLEAVGKKQLGKLKQHGGFTLRRLVLNSSGAGAYLIWPQGARKLLNRYSNCGAALADVFINETRDLQSWQLVPAIAIQQCMLPYYGLATQDEGLSQISREQFASPLPPSIRIALGMRIRRLIGEMQKGFIKLWGLISHQRQFIPFQTHQRHS